MKKIIYKILSIIGIIATILSFYTIIKINLLPIKYIVLIGTIFLLINIGFIFLLFRKKVIFQILGIIILIVLLIGCGISTYYIESTNHFLKESFSGKVKETTTYYIVGLKEKNYKEDSIKGKIASFENLYNKEKVLKIIEEEYDIENITYNSINEMIEDLLNEKIPFMITESISYNIIREMNENIDKKLEIIKEIDIVKELEAKENNLGVFNIYIVGTDFAGLNDFNMLVTVNTKTKKVLLTSIPRDFHIEVAGYNGIKDNITYLSALGIDTSINSIGNFLETNIDYYVKINTKSLVTLVDKIGGITFCSDISFTTKHALVLDTYDDRGKQKLYVKEGCQHLNGIETLTVARERMIPGSDIARQENCRKIMVAILNQLKSINTVTNFNELLDALSGSYETTIPREIITNIAQDALKSNSKWQLLEQNVTGEDVKGYVHLNTVYDYIMVPNMETVEKAKNTIRNIESE